MFGFYTGIRMSEWDDLIDEAWSLYSRGGGAVVRPSVPILWFGDSVAYARSNVRVVTVGLNPSRVEFPQADRLLRFQAARPLTAPPATAVQRAAYVSSLDSYFRSTPYRGWFDQGFERVLNGLSASYYEGFANTAVHTDLLSPLATDPTWSGLSIEARASLAAGGTPLWHKVIRALQPDVIVASVARAHLDRICFPRLPEPARTRHVRSRRRVVHSAGSSRPTRAPTGP